MKKISLALVLLTLSGCINIAISPEVNGRVTDSEGNPLVATVQLQNDQLQNKLETTTTSPDGSFSVGAIRVWTPVPFLSIAILNTLTVTSPGFRPIKLQYEGYDEVSTDVILEKAE